MVHPLFWVLMLIMIIIVAIMFLKELIWIPRALFDLFTFVYKIAEPKSSLAKILAAVVSIMFGFLIVSLAGGLFGLFSPIWSNFVGFVLVMGAIILVFCAVLLGERFSRGVKDLLSREHGKKSPGLFRHNLETGEYTCFCQACRKGYPDKNGSWDKNEKSVQCDECNAWFCSAQSCLELLLNTGKCPKCGYPFSIKQKHRLEKIRQGILH